LKRKEKVGVSIPSAGLPRSIARKLFYDSLVTGTTEIFNHDPRQTADCGGPTAGLTFGIMRSHEWTDQRSLALDRAVAEKLRAEPALVDRARQTLGRWLDQVNL
jgi:hypothetical protein